MLSIFGQTAIAASVNLRCYGLATPRHDDKVSVHLADIEHFKHEWSINDLPWDVVTPVGVGDEHPGSLDFKLLEAITTRALPDPIHPKAKQAVVAFLYMYMILSHGDTRCVISSFIAIAAFSINDRVSGRLSITPPEPPFR